MGNQLGPSFVSFLTPPRSLVVRLCSAVLGWAEMDGLTPLAEDGDRWKEDAREWIACDENPQVPFQ